MKTNRKAIKQKSLGWMLAGSLLLATVATSSWAGVFWHVGFSSGPAPAMWRWRGATVQQWGCRRVVIRRYCRENMWGMHQCFRERYVNWVP